MTKKEFINKFINQYKKPINKEVEEQVEKDFKEYFLENQNDCTDDPIVILAEYFDEIRKIIK